MDQVDLGFVPPLYQSETWMLLSLRMQKWNQVHGQNWHSLMGQEVPFVPQLRQPQETASCNPCKVLTACAASPSASLGSNRRDWYLCQEDCSCEPHQLEALWAGYCSKAHSLIGSLSLKGHRHIERDLRQNSRRGIAPPKKTLVGAPHWLHVSSKWGEQELCCYCAT